MARKSVFRARHDDEAGSYSLELAVLFPAFLLLVLILVQAALYFYGRSVASSAAQQGADVGRLQGNTAAQGASAATAFVNAQGGGVLIDTSTTAARSTTAKVTVSVTGRVLTVIPGLHFTITQQASAPREQYTTATGAGTS